MTAFIRLLVCLILLLTATTHAAEPPLKFWHTQSGERGELLSQIISEYNASNPPLPVEGSYQGVYNDIYEKTRATLLGGDPPDLAVAYETYIPEFMELAEVVDLDPLMNDPKIGLTADEQADIFPAFLQANRFQRFDNALLSFPFTKSLLILYVNEDLLRQAGFQAAPRTWPEFEAQCKAMQAIGKRGYALELDPSTLDGMFMSRGVALVNEEQPASVNFDAPGVAETLEMLRRLVAEGHAYQVDGLRDEDVREFSEQNCAFIIRSSTRRPVLERSIGDAFKWSMNPIPAGEGLEPMTITYGANICVFGSTPERERAAWQFIKFFISPEVTARWAVGSGYLPVRKSAEALPVMQQWFNENPMNRSVFEMIPLGKFEPSLKGWQEVRALVRQAATDAIIGRGGRTSAELAADLDRQAEALLNPPEARRGITAKLFFGLLAVGVAIWAVRFLRRRRRPTAAAGEP